MGEATLVGWNLLLESWVIIAFAAHREIREQR
jgi:hypothetical protein